MRSNSDTSHTRAIALLSAAAFASSTSARLCDPMLPELIRYFTVTPAAAAQAVSAFSIAYGVMQFVIAPLGEYIGRYRLVALTTLACTLGSVAAALAPSIDWLVVARFMMGATAAGIIPVSMAWIGDTVPYKDRQATLAHFLGGQTLGVIGGQFVGGLFVDTIGWRWAFAFLAATYLLIGFVVLSESRSNPSTHHAHTARKMGPIAQALSVLGSSWARVILAVSFLEGMLIYGGLALIPTYLHERFEVSLTVAGGLMAAFGLGGLSYILFARYSVRRFGEVGLAVIGGGLLASAWLLLALAPSWVWILPATYLSGLGFYAFHGTLQIHATQMAPQARGTGVALFASSFFLGQALGVVAAAVVLERLGSYSLFVGTACCILAFSSVFAWLLSRRHGSAIS